MTQPVLKVEGLTKHFFKGKNLLSMLAKGARKSETVHALEDVSFNLGQKETLGLLGESGSGKTTLLRTISRLIEPTSGRALYDGKDIFSMDAEELQKVRAQVRMIFQHPDSVLNPACEVGRVLVLALKQMENNERTPEELLDMVGLSKKYFSKYPHELSGGEKRRVGIARAFATNPKVILADEVVSGLDVVVQKQIVELFRELRAESGISMIFVSHDTNLVLQFSDRIAVMFGGMIMELAPSSIMVEKKARHPYTNVLLRIATDFQSGSPMRYKFDAVDENQNGVTGCPYVGACSLWRELGKPQSCQELRPQLKAVDSSDAFVACHYVGESV